MIETLAQIMGESRGRPFVAGIVLWSVDDDRNHDRCVEAAPVCKFTKGWTRQQIRSYAGKRQWTCQVVHELERERPEWWHPPARTTTSPSPAK